MRVGDIYEGRVTDMNGYGAGVMKIDGAVVFVSGAVTGDYVRVRITETKKNCAFAAVEEIKEYSAHRIAPVCQRAGECGGCVFCGIDGDYENEVKRSMVVSAFRAADLDSSVVGQTISSPSRTEYRNKITLHYSDAIDGFGMYAEGTNDALRFEACPLVSEKINSAVGAVNSLCPEIRKYSPSSLIVRSCDEGLNLSLYLDNPRISSELKEKIAVSSGARVFVYDSNGHGDSGYYTDRIAGIDMRFSSEAFRQVNTGAFELLLGKVGELTDGLDFTTAADLYCGSGIIGLYLAKRRAGVEIWGIEINPDAVRDAEYNAANNGITNAHYFCGDAASFPERTGVHPELCVVDPPRAGLSDGMRAGLMRLAPENIIYVSCNPRTLARDAKELTAGGWKIISATPVNVFAMTGHVETVVLLSGGKSQQT